MIRVGAVEQKREAVDELGSAVAPVLVRVVAPDADLLPARTAAGAQ